MKKLLAVFLFGMASIGFADTTTNRLGLTLPTIGSPTYGQKINTDFQILDATVNVIINGGGSGGGGVSGSINASTINSVGFYSGNGSTTIISGIPPGTSGQFLTTGGASDSPFWSTASSGGSTLPLPAGATNYIQVTSSLQSGATFYVSSGTVVSQLVIGSDGNPDQKIFPTSSPSGVLWQFDTAPIPTISPYEYVQFTNGAIAGGLKGVVFENGSQNQSYAIDPVAPLFSARGKVVLSSATSLAGEVTISTGVILNGTEGTNGQVFTSGGPGTAPTWTNAASGGVSSLGVNYNGVQITSPTAQINFTGSGVSVSATGSTATVTISGGGGSSNVTMASQLGDFALTTVNASTQAIGSLCSPTTPCQTRTDTVQFLLTQASSVSISGTSSSGAVYWYVTAGGILTVGHNTGATLTCLQNCQVATSITEFPSGSIPLWISSFTSNAWNPVVETMDDRAFISHHVIYPGSGIASTSDPTTGIQTLTTDSTIVPRYFTGASTPTQTCAQGRDFYTDTVTSQTWTCGGTANTWEGPLSTSTTGGGGGSTSPGGSNTQVQYNNASAFGGISGSAVGTSSVTFGPLSVTTSTVITINPGDYLLSISSSSLGGSATDYSLDTYGNSIQTGSATITNGIVGNILGTNASAGIVGEYISTSAASAVAFPSSGNFGDLASMSLTAGDWNVSAVLGSQANSATVTTMSVGISSTTGNSSAGLVEGDSYIKGLGPTAATDTALTIPSFRVVLTTTKTYYLKYSAGFSVATPNAVGRLSARRIR